MANLCAKLCEVCSTGSRLRLLTGFIALWMREHFSLATAIEDPALQARVWKPTQDTGILIESISKWDPTTTGKRPAIIVKRNSQNILRQIIEDRLMPGMGPEATRGMYSSFRQGSHTVFCIGGESAETEILAEEVLRELMHFAVVLRHPLRLHKLLVTEVGELALLEEADENFVVPITIAYAFEDSWEITNNAPLVTRVDLSVFS
jgi:hypothetical protein